MTTIELSKQVRADAIASIQRYFKENMPEPIGRCLQACYSTSSSRRLDLSSTIVRFLRRKLECSSACPISAVNYSPMSFSIGLDSTQRSVKITASVLQPRLTILSLPSYTNLCSLWQ